MPVRTIAAIVSGLILVNMPPMPSSSPPSSSGRIEIGHACGGGTVGRAEVLVGHPHSATALTSRVSRRALSRSASRRCLPRPGRLGAQVIGPLAQSATALHIYHPTTLRPPPRNPIIVSETSPATAVKHLPAHTVRASDTMVV